MANSVTARFNDDCKVFVSMSDDTTVEKAVIIDAEGNETDIGGGGGESDFSTAVVTIKAGNDIDGLLSWLPLLASDGLRTATELTLNANEQTTKEIALYKGKAIVGSFGFFTVDNISGNITVDDNEYYIITGDCSVTLSPAE